ncbi:phosphoglycerate dehydrogenase [Pontibacter qinzhouensis]|uniref:Phosphoglycerate dehydrogenase n=1 Tax=Pontibacter qinzhouensis TaxID=2603253 RepID=A0A5C8J6W8_9BACT|nr:NAD(P)-dependent oxidoreductase [Pontibacter qinzhouensis]TXK33219.1 phosphoglycerate dehydrogenase [Pontibacter qinzhouensis]
MSTSTFRCLIIDEMHPSILEMLEAIGVAADYRPEMQPAEVPAALEDVDGLIVRSKMRITTATVAKATRLRFVARAGAGLDNIEVEQLEQLGIKVLGANEGNREAVGEHALGMLLALVRNIARSDRQVRDKVWLREENRGEEIGGKTVGIIGYGNMGQSFSRVLSGVGCRILAYDCYAPQKIGTPAISATIEQLQTEADIVSLHIPYFAGNRHFADEAFFRGFAKPIWFINTARGEVVDQSALVRQLQQGKVKGAALDVLENEKLQTFSERQQQDFEYLQNASNVVLTPHIAGWTQESYKKINEVLAAKIKQVLYPF